jgi:uncharacterized protein (DUF1684 family)
VILHKDITAAAALLLGLIPLAFASGTTNAVYRAEIEKWRQQREARLKSDDGWLTVAGLFWLKEGDNPFGSSPLNDIVLPEPSEAAEAAGNFILRGGKITLHVNSPAKGTKATGRGGKNVPVKVLLNGKPLHGDATMLPDSDDKGPSVLTIGDLTLLVHASGARLGIRLKDKNSRLRREFAGLKWFPVDETYRVTAQYLSYAAPKEVQIPNILGDVDKMSSPGEVVLTLGGKHLRMEAVQDDPNSLWFIFRDLTSGKETYGAARFLYSDLPVNGKVVLDFNKAYNPPCAFNPFTTCPLPPPENRLPVRIEAGEMKYSHGH